MFTDPWHLIVLALATSRLTGLWFEEIARPVRSVFVRRGGKLEYFASCQLCVSVWAAGAVVGLWNVAPWLMLVLALSGAVIHLQQILMRAPIDPGRAFESVGQELAALRAEVTRLNTTIQTVSVEKES